MQKFNVSSHACFYAIGLSYKKADATLRGKFSLTQKQKPALISTAKFLGIEGLLTISTCNRTELYAFAQKPEELIALLCQFTVGSIAEFKKVGYVYKNETAIDHLFKVGTGLDSQILGDFEIIGQLKQGFYLSKQYKISNPFLERLCNAVIQASKRIKNETEISTGATSVSFAAVKYILQNVKDISTKNILLFGTGKIGRNTCENLLKHSNNSHITLINRTKERAEKFGKKFELKVKPFGDLQSEIRKSDILVVATGAHLPTVAKSLVHPKKPLLILDLSVPKNVNENVTQVPNVTLVHLDHLSKITDETLSKRNAQVPQAKAIITAVKADFYNWLDSRKFAPVIKALKSKLKTLKEEEINFHAKKISNFNTDQANQVSNRIIQKITKQFVNHLKDNNEDATESLELIQQIFQLEIKQ